MAGDGGSVQSSGSASDKQCELPLGLPGDEPDAGKRSDSESVHLSPLMVRVLSRENHSRALKQVRRNKGAPGIDGMTVDALPDFLREHWPEIRQPGVPHFGPIFGGPETVSY